MYVIRGEDIDLNFSNITSFEELQPVNLKEEVRLMAFFFKYYDAIVIRQHICNVIRYDILCHTSFKYEKKKKYITL
jgi:hypothetical protein